MARFEILRSWLSRKAVLPPITETIDLSKVIDDPDIGEAPECEPEPISAFLCIIQYDGEDRLITCRRYEGIGDQRYVGAHCHQAGGYRQFRCDRIEAVHDAQTGEQLGDGAFFARFAVDGWRDKAPTWGLKPTQKGRLVAGLNVLAFMARCDGSWHNLEKGVIEQFVTSLWLRQEWPGDPDLASIVGHTERLAPDGDTFFKALKHYAENQQLRKLLRRSIGDLIAADGRICPAEMNWATEVDAFFDERDAASDREFLARWPDAGRADL
jgi:hypothetical protein